MDNWKDNYPYTLDPHLEKALALSLDNNDNLTAKKIWEIFISYRKSKIELPKTKLEVK